MFHQTFLKNYSDFQLKKIVKDLVELRASFYSQLSIIVNNNNDNFVKESQLFSNEFEKFAFDRTNFDSEFHFKKYSAELFKKMMIFNSIELKSIINLILMENPLFEYYLIEYHFKLITDCLDNLELNPEEKYSQILKESKSQIFSLINLLLAYKNFNRFLNNDNKNVKLVAMINKLFKHLCFKLKALLINKNEILEKYITKVQLLLFESNQDTPFLKVFIKANYEFYRQTIVSKNFGDAIILSLINFSNENIKCQNTLWKKLFVFMLEEKFCFLKLLIEECLIFISKNQFDFLNFIFSIRELSELKETILFIGISKTIDINCAKKLVNLLSSSHNKLIPEKIANTFKSHFDFINWFLNQNKYFFK